MISIIIPALNEEEYLPLLLESIKKQSLKDCEIILADAGSTDKTLEIAREYNCKIIPGGLPAKGRNEGAKIARGDLLFFCDADVILPDRFFEEALSEFEKRKLDFASFCIIPLPKSKFSKFILDVFYNQPIVLLQSALPHAATGIIYKKELFDKTGGFDEDIKLAEDHYLARRTLKLFKDVKFGIIKSTYIYVSDRRFKTDGWISVGIRYFLCELHLIFIGPVKSDIFKYKFDHYKNRNAPKK